MRTRTSELIGISMLLHTRNLVTYTNSAHALLPRVVAQLAACEEVYRCSDNKSSCPSELPRDTTAWSSGLVVGVYVYLTRIQNTPARETIVEKLVPITLNYIAMFTRPVLVTGDPLMRGCFRPRSCSDHHQTRSYIILAW